MRVLFSKKIAALSKPRCGSTSLRSMLDPLVDEKAGDIAVNVGGKRPPFHPHITAPFLKQVLKNKGHDPDELEYIITVRHPVSMLWSYYKFFKPDMESRYTFSPKWDEQNRMDFEAWVLTGRLKPFGKWWDLAPDWIRADDLSSLSLEFRAMNRNSELEVDHVFRLEEPEVLLSWIEGKIGRKIPMKHTNTSETAPLPDLGSETMAKIKQMFPYESDLYGI